MLGFLLGNATTQNWVNINSMRCPTYCAKSSFIFLIFYLFQCYSKWNSFLQWNAIFTQALSDNPEYRNTRHAQCTNKQLNKSKQKSKHPERAPAVSTRPVNTHLLNNGKQREYCSKYCDMEWIRNVQHIVQRRCPRTCCPRKNGCRGAIAMLTRKKSLAKITTAPFSVFSWDLSPEQLQKRLRKRIDAQQALNDRNMKAFSFISLFHMTIRHEQRVNSCLFFIHDVGRFCNSLIHIVCGPAHAAVDTVAIPDQWDLSQMSFFLLTIRFQWLILHQMMLCRSLSANNWNETRKCVFSLVWTLPTANEINRMHDSAESAQNKQRISQIEFEMQSEI